MRLKSVYISHYKNLNEFTLRFDGDSFIDVFVGKNGSGKSNLFEALIEIFRHIFEFDKNKNVIEFDYSITYEIDGNNTTFEWKAGKLKINDAEDRKTIGKILLPDNILIYYSGHNDKVTELVKDYETTFRARIKTANLEESRRFIGIGSDYKSLLLAVILTQPAGNVARDCLCRKLGIASIGTDLTIRLSRPSFAKSRLQELGVSAIDNLDLRTHYWGANGITREFLDKLLSCIKGEFHHRDLYDTTEDKYQIIINLDLYRQKFKGDSLLDIFRSFDNLKTLGMLADISLPVKLTIGSDTDIVHFSDGQFQSVYIYSVVELFKDRNCITLLDEPDCFLHPEWQFDFLKQVFEITATAKKNHVLMSSHSASTITTAKDDLINLFEFDGNKVVIKKVKKADVIKALSAGLITFSETEARLNIQHVLKNTTKSVLFTEGITDEMILETAWSKLHPGIDRNFDIQNAFSCGFLRNLVKDNTLYQNYPGRMFFSLFDFDEAYSDWNQLGQDVLADPCRCLVKKHNNYESYALLLPVPATGQIRNQVINPSTGRNYGNRSQLTIELLFHGVPGLERHFGTDTERTDNFIKFIGDKVVFARDIVPSRPAPDFEGFRPIFDFISQKCQPVPASLITASQSVPTPQ